MRGYRVLVTALLIGCSLLVREGRTKAQSVTVTFDTIYVRVPRGGDTVGPRLPDSTRPVWIDGGASLIHQRADGTEEVLVDAGTKGAVLDPCVSFDAKTVYYAYVSDATDILSAPANSPRSGSDIYKVNVATKQITRLTFQEFTPNTSVPLVPGIVPIVYNLGPCPVSGGKIVFTSSRDGFSAPHGGIPFTTQLYTMDEDGTNIDPIGRLNVGAGLNPFQLKNGEIAFSSYESQGLRDPRLWGLWSIWPDGRKWKPLLSAFSQDSVFRLATQLSGGDLVVDDYYNLYNSAFGRFLRFPLECPTSTCGGFNSAFLADNPPLAYTDRTLGLTSERYGFSPQGIFANTPFATAHDESSATGPDGQLLGKVRDPAAAPGNNLLLVWSPGPVNFQNRPTQIPYPDAGIYLAKDGEPVLHPRDLILIKNDPAYNEIFPRALVPYKAIYGIDEPQRIPYLPNDGTVHPDLPVGTPYGIVGSSGVYKRESFPGISTPGANYDGLDPFNCAIQFCNSNLLSQGGDIGKFANSDIYAIRFLVEEPTTPLRSGGKAWHNVANERMRVLGDVPLRKTDANGQPILDPEGNPDTSFSVKIPADTPFTFALVDKDGYMLTLAETWHQIRPGEVRVDCGGCHAHSQIPLLFARTMAAKLPPVDLTHVLTRSYEFTRDIRPLLQRACVSCHNTANASGGLNLDIGTGLVAGSGDDAGLGTPRDYATLARNVTSFLGGAKTVQPSGTYGFLNSSRWQRKLAARRSMWMWKIAGRRLDGWTNDSFPTELIPGDASTLPAGTPLNMVDVDYHDTAHHELMLTAAEQRIIATWIDTGACVSIDTTNACDEDENKPTLTLKRLPTLLYIGVSDADTGIDVPSLSVKVNGQTAVLTDLHDGRWTAPIPVGDITVDASVKDKAGNITARLWTLKADAVVPPPPPPPPPPALPAPKNLRIEGPADITRTPAGNGFPINLFGRVLWDPVPGAVSYEVEITWSSGTVFVKWFPVLGNNGYPLPRGMFGHQYKIRVRACADQNLTVPPDALEGRCWFGAPASTPSGITYTK